jgi:hypothetical protein
MNNQPRQILSELISQHGPSICKEPQRLKDMLRDLCGDAYKREVNILSFALDEQVPQDLMAKQADPSASQLLMPPLTKRLQDAFAMSEDGAKWAVESWALALGVLTEALKAPKHKEGKEGEGKEGEGKEGEERLRREAEAARRQAEREKQQREAAEGEKAEEERQRGAASIKPLSPWNPLDHLRLLWWTLVTPQQLKAHREQFGEKAELPTAKWLISTLLWLPFFLPFSAVGFGIVPFSLPYLEFTLIADHYLWASGGLFIAWLGAGLFGDGDEEAVALVVTLTAVLAVALAVGMAVVPILAGVLAVVLAAGLAGVLMVGLAVVLAVALGGVLPPVLPLGLAVVLMGVPAAGLAVVLPVGLANAVKESLKTGRASWKTKGAFGLLVAAYAFLVWYSYLGGWRMFEGWG